MEDHPWSRDEVESPCVRICLMHPTERICTGCFRTLDEIARWSQMTAQERRAVIAALPARAPQLSRRRGGRSGRATT
ncbi:MAG: DUF1289 domain-containing protein [Pseudodonghicola sp.]